MQCETYGESRAPKVHGVHIALLARLVLLARLLGIIKLGARYIKLAIFTSAIMGIIQPFGSTKTTTPTKQHGCIVGWA